MTHNDITFVYFDLGDTLVQIRHELQADTVREIAAAKGETLNSKQQRARALAEYKAACDAEWAERSDDILKVRTDADERAYWPDYFAAVLRRLQIATPSAELIDLLARRQADPHSFECLEEAEETLERLAHAGIKLGIISNSFPSAEKILDHLDLSRWFKKHLVLSHELLCAKPSLEIYEHAIQLTGQSSRQIMYVDDRPVFVRGADEAALEAVLFDSTGQYRHEWTGRTIRQLTKLTKLIGIESDYTRRGKRKWLNPYVAATVALFQNVFQNMLVVIRSIPDNMLPMR